MVMAKVVERAMEDICIFSKTFFSYFVPVVYVVS